MYTHQWGHRNELGPPPNKFGGHNTLHLEPKCFRLNSHIVKMLQILHSENPQWITVADQPMRSYKSYPRAADVLCAEM